MGVTVLLGMFMFTAIILGLVGVLMIARDKLVSSGDVTILVNGNPDNSIQVKAGGTLLNVLAEQKIFIPSACGGKGSCGVCTVTVN